VARLQVVEGEIVDRGGHISLKVESVKFDALDEEETDGMG